MFNIIIFFIMAVGGIDWLCIGLFQFDFVASIFGSQAHFVSRFLYTIIGLATVYMLIALPIKKGKIYSPKLKQAKQSQPIKKRVFYAQKSTQIQKPILKKK